MSLSLFFFTNPDVQARIFSDGENSWAVMENKPVSLCPSDFIVFSENVLTSHFNRTRDWCETMETNPTKKKERKKNLLAESLSHNYSATSDLFHSVVFLLPFYSPDFITAHWEMKQQGVHIWRQQNWPFGAELQSTSHVGLTLLLFTLEKMGLWMSSFIIYPDKIRSLFSCKVEDTV